MFTIAVKVGTEIPSPSTLIFSDRIFEYSSSPKNCTPRALGCVKTTTLGVKTQRNSFGCMVRGAKRKSCTPKWKKIKTLAEVEEFENGNILPDNCGCVNS